MAKRLIWSQAALRDYEDIIDFVADRDGIEHAERLHRKVHPAILALSNSPERCRVVPELKALGVTVYRELIVSSYRVAFRIQGRDIIVLGVFDGRRDLEEVLVSRLTER